MQCLYIWGARHPDSTLLDTLLGSHSRVASLSVLRVKYEDLASDPRCELQRICAFAQIEYEPTMLDFRSKVHHNVNGNNMRQESASKIRLDTTWQTKLPEEEKAFFMRRAGWLNEQFGCRY